MRIRGSGWIRCRPFSSNKAMISGGTLVVSAPVLRGPTLLTGSPSRRITRAVITSEWRHQTSSGVTGRPLMTCSRKSSHTGLGTAKQTANKTLPTIAASLPIATDVLTDQLTGWGRRGMSKRSPLKADVLETLRCTACSTGWQLYHRPECAVIGILSPAQGCHEHTLPATKCQSPFYEPSRIQQSAPKPQDNVTLPIF